MSFRAAQRWTVQLSFLAGDRGAIYLEAGAVQVATR